MTVADTAIARAAFAAIGTSASVVLTEPDGIEHAERTLRAHLDDLDRTASRFRADSELSRLVDRPGRPSEISPALTMLLAAALRAAALTDGLVDPTVGRAVLDAGYDRDFALLAGRTAPVRQTRPAPGWRSVHLDEATRELSVPAAVRLDLGATAKAVAADQAADAIATDLGCGVLVELGGDVAVRGQAPRGGWLIELGEEVRSTGPRDGPSVAIHDGGLATSSTTARTWRRGDGTAHHIVDPRTGDVAEPVWRAVSVAAATCLDANTAATAAIVLGADAADWLADRGLPARLVPADGGGEVTVAGWPAHPAAIRADRRARP